MTKPKLRRWRCARCDATCTVPEDVLPNQVAQKHGKCDSLRSWRLIETKKESKKHGSR